MNGRTIAAATAVALLAAACNSSADTASDSVPDAVGAGDAAPDTSPLGADFTEVEVSPTSTVEVSAAPEREPVPEGALVDVCPQRLVVQLDDVPGVEHGPLYQLLGASPTVDETAQSVSAPIERIDATIEGVTLEVRSGGPVVDFRSPLQVLADDESVNFAIASTADVIDAVVESTEPDSAPTSVMTLTDRSHDVVFWDPETYPQMDGLPALVDAGVEIRHAPAEPFIDFLVATGVLADATLTDSFLGEPAAFVAANGSIAQQGDALTDPFLFENLPQWGRAIELAFAADSGWSSYDDTLVVRSSDVAGLDECLTRFVPALQEASVAYVGDPSTAHELISFVRTGFNPLTRTSVAALDRGLADGIAEGLVGTHAGQIVGDFDPERLADFVAAYTESLGLDTVTIDDIADTSFLANVTG